MGKMGRLTAVGRSQRGMAYLALLIAVAVMGVGLAATASLWHEARQREKERELLFVGEQFRRAIQQYYENSLGIKKYPMALEELLQDWRYPGTRRYLRQMYRDPLTNDAKWGLVMAPQGGIMGVYSLGKGVPIKQAGFEAILAALEGKQSYAEWGFIYIPASPQ